MLVVFTPNAVINPARVVITTSTRTSLKIGGVVVVHLMLLTLSVYLFLEFLLVISFADVLVDTE